MRHRLALTVLLAVCTPWVVQAEYYKVRITRTGPDTYRDEGSGRIILTQHCYEYPVNAEAILQWEGEWGRNRLIFAHVECAVVGLR